MKQTMLELMVQMMPYMMWLVYAGAALVAIAILAMLAQFVTGRGGGLANLAARLLVLLGIFFLACQLAGILLGAPPSINFADSTKGDFDLKPFWQVGLAFLIPGIVVALFTRRR